MPTEIFRVFVAGFAGTIVLPVGLYPGTSEVFCALTGGSVARGLTMLPLTPCPVVLGMEGVVTGPGAGACGCNCGTWLTTMVIVPLEESTGLPLSEAKSVAV